MKTSESIVAIAPALCKAISEIKTIEKDAKNPFLKNKYASLDAIIEGSKATLAAHSICVMQTVNECGVETILLHGSGEWISSDCLKIAPEQGKGMSLAQSVGVTITYAKRYQLAGMLNISTGEDVDGQFNEGNDTKPVAPKAKPMELPAISDDRVKRACELISKGNMDARESLIKTFTLTPDQFAMVQDAIDLFNFNNPIQ